MSERTYRLVTTRIDERVERHRIDDVHSGRTLTRGQFVQRLARDGRLWSTLSAAVADAPFEAVFLELVPLSRDRSERAFGFVLVDAPSLAPLRADPRPFARHLSGAARVARFPNIGGDAMLVAPCPPAGGPADHGAHLASFVRRGDPDHVAALWREVGAALADRVAAAPDRPVWTSTSGLGVAWLHVRLDTAPKYYVHAPYRSPGA